MSLPIVLAIVFLIDGIVWSFSTLFVMFYVLRHHELPMLLGIKLLSGPFSNSLGIETMVPIILSFILVNSLKFLAAYWLWHLNIEGAVLGLILICLSSIYWYGFLLPAGPILGVVELILIVLVWSRFG